MKINTIASSSNALLKKIRGLQERNIREKTGLFLLEGMRPVEEAISRGLKLDNVVVSGTYLESSTEAINLLKLAEISVTEDRIFKELHGTTSSCGIVATAAIPRFAPADIFRKPKALVVVCDSVQDPGNLGTIVRSAFAADAAGVVLTRGAVDAWGPKVVRSAVGALFQIPILTEYSPSDCLQLLSDHEVPVWVCDAAAPVLYFQANLTGPVALVFGNEAKGICVEFMNGCTGSLRIPMREGSESLNVGVSAGIILSESYKQRLVARS